MWNDSEGQWQMMDGDGTWWGVAVVMCLIVIAAAVALAVLVMRDPQRGWRREGGGAAPETDPAVDILRRRLARGEIDQADFESRLLLLEREEPRG